MAIADIIKSWFKKDTKKPAPAPKTQQEQPKTKTGAGAGSAPATAKTAKATPAPTPAAAKPEPVSTGNSLLDKVFHSPQLSISLMALAKIDDQELLAEVIVKHNIAKIRQEAAARLTSPDVLARTAEKIKHSDKGVYRVLRKKLDEHNANAKAAAKHQQTLEKICRDLESNNRQTANPLFAAKVQSLHQQWQQATADIAAPEALLQRYQSASAAIQSLVEQQQQQKQASDAAANQQQQSLAQLQLQLDAILQQDELPNPDDCRQSIQQAIDNWQTSLELAKPDNGASARFKQLEKQLAGLITLVENTYSQLDTLQQLVSAAIAQPEDAHNTLNLKDLLKQLAPARLSEVPPVLTHARAVLVQAEKRLAQVKTATAAPAAPDKARSADSSPEFIELIKQLEQAIAEGNSRTAGKQLKAAQQLAKSQHIHEPRLAQWAAELHKLKEWAGFAILPKKEALVAQMRALAEQPETDGPERLDQIKALQAEWQAVGMVNNDAEKTLWREFKDLSQVAYQPCQRHFDEQKLIQEANARNREALCAELQNYLDMLPAEVNWQVHISILKKAREDWQKFHPVEAKVHKKLQARFNDILKGLEQKLHDEYARQAARKQAIIEQAEKLLTLDNQRDACQQAKDLQQQWKEVGSCGHAKDQALWEQFRQHCDAIFARRENEKHNRQQQEQVAIELAKTLLAELTHCLAQAPTAEQAKQVEDLSNRIQELPLPREIYQDTRQQLHTLREQWQQQLSSQQQQEKVAQLSDVIDAITLCFNTENRVLAGQSVSADDQAQWNAFSLPPLFAAALNKRWQALPQLAARSSHTGQFNATCLFLELLLDIPSPDSEKQARTAKKILVFQQQSYPKTLDEKRNITQHLLTQMAGFSGLTLVEQADALARMRIILSTPELGTLI